MACKFLSDHMWSLRKFIIACVEKVVSSVRNTIRAKYRLVPIFRKHIVNCYLDNASNELSLTTQKKNLLAVSVLVNADIVKTL